MQRGLSNHQDSSIHGTVTSHDEEGFVSSVSPQVLRGRSRWWTSLTHLDRVMAARTPRQLPYIHIVRRDVNMRRAPNGRAQCHHSPLRLWLRIYTKASVLYVPRHGLFMGYIARYLPPTRVLTPLLSHLLPFLSLRFTFSFFILSPFSLSSH